MHFRHSNQSHYGCVIPAKAGIQAAVARKEGLPTMRAGFRLALRLAGMTAEVFRQQSRMPQTFGESHSSLCPGNLVNAGTDCIGFEDLLPIGTEQVGHGGINGLQSSV